MANTLNSAAILREAAYTEGYKAGKKDAAKEIIDYICQIGGCSRGIVLNPWDILELKEKWGIK